MIGCLNGNLLLKESDKLIVDVRGVGYEVIVPVSVFYQLPQVGYPVTLYIHTHVREDQLQLYGFLTPAQKDFFQLMLGVSGIGPKVALNISSEISPSELHQVVLTSNTQKLSSMKGIGKKTAERLILELKTKVKKLALHSDPATVEASKTEVDDLISALSNLGYKQMEIDRAVHQVRLQDKTQSFEEMLKQSLQYLRT
ncbi:MAG: Holliday junction DNA helicase RuvA [Deltaproteobacteria bacterium RIFCSPHIGHO2_02_FULL_40_11]|nr:MAG: Holliday junction DNA helicase RuvA [Deltaproteobacteria bacterium RIFCSPHIGHO2_02_FULL_40_11]